MKAMNDWGIHTNPETKNLHVESCDEFRAIFIFECLKARTELLNGLYFSSLSDDSFHHGGILAAAEALRSNVNLATLQLTIKHNFPERAQEPFSDEDSPDVNPDWAFTQLCRGLETNSHLTTMAVSGFIPHLEADGITASPGTMAFCRMLRSNTTLQTVHLHLGHSDQKGAYDQPGISPSPAATAMVDRANSSRAAPLKIIYGGHGLGLGSSFR